MINGIEDNIKSISSKRIERESLIEKIYTINSELPNKKDRKKILSALIERLIHAMQEKQLDNILGLVRVIFLCDFPNVIIQVKKMGVFRASNYNYESKSIKWVIREIESLGCLENDEELTYYLNNINQLLVIVPEVHSEYSKILSAMRSRNNFYKTLLAFGELVYIDFYNDPRYFICESIGDKIFSKNKEAVIESVSLISEIYQKNIGVCDKDFIFIDENFIFSYYWDLIYKGHKLFIYKQTEIQLDYFPLGVKEKSTRGNVLVDHNDFEKCKANGYYKYDIKNLALTVDHIREYNRDDSLQDYFERVYETLNNKCDLQLYAIHTEPKARIVLQIPDFSENGLHIMQSSELLEDELLYLKTLCNDNYNVEIINMIVFEELSILDVIKIKRIFDFISFLYIKGIEELAKDNIVLALSSILPVLEYSKLIDLVERFSGLSQPKCKSIIDYLSFDLSKSNSVTDLQYQPILRLKEKCMFLPSILAKSNIVRSMAINNGIHLSAFDDRDHMMEMVKDAFLKQGFQIVIDFKFGVDEVDIVAYKDGQLFIFECKNPYHPTNVYELRNTYGHIKKGFSQLEKFKIILNDTEKCKRFISKTNFQSVTIEGINFGLINANRALSGYTEGEFTVYHANELIKFLTDGMIRFMDKRYLTWENDIFTVKDLIAYMKGRVSKDIFYALCKDSYSIKYRSARLETPVYLLDEELLDSIIKRSYSLVT